MKTIKLSEWCDKRGVSYLTAWRWFKKGKMPVNAYQTETGTILVEDDEDIFAPSAPSETQQDNAMVLFIKKTTEFSKNESSIEDFAAYILSNFILKLNTIEHPKYSRNKPKSEEVQKHFKKFLPNNVKPTPAIFIPDPKVWENISENSEDFVGTNGESQGLVNQIRAIDADALVSNSLLDIVKTEGIEEEDLQKTLGSLVGSTIGNIYDVSGVNSSFLTGESPILGSAITNTDLNPKNYTYSTNCVSSVGDNILGDNSVFANFYNAINKTNSPAANLSMTEKPKRGRPRKK